MVIIEYEYEYDDQCEHNDIPLLDSMPGESDITKSYDVIVDAIFGFSFSGAIRAPFDSVIKSMINSHVDIVSVDIPSGWHVEDGDINNTGLLPKMLVSLTAPKCM